MTTLFRGFKVGHYTDTKGLTGCTVIVPPRGNVTSCDIPGSSPGSREIESLHPDKRLTEIHGLLLTGGSAFGLAAAEGVVEWLSEQGIGFYTPVATIPIVPAAVVFDLGTGDANARPGREHGRLACEDLREEGIATGRVGAGTGCTVGKWAGREHLVPGGLGIATVEDRGVTVAALAVVNAVGDVLDRDGSVLAGTRAVDPVYRPPSFADDNFTSNTVLACLVTEADLTKADVRFLAARGSDGITTSIRPAHTRYDGDAVFAIAAPAAPDAPAADLDLLGFLATQAVSEAVRNAVR
ncbi:MAG: P1 family peptidase [Actinomycetota bacterium]